MAKRLTTEEKLRREMAKKVGKIRKFVARSKAVLAKWMAVPVDEIPVCVSDGNDKIGRVMNVSLLPIFSCHNCKSCACDCYDVKDCRYGSVLDARVRNYIVAVKKPSRLFDEVRRRMAVNRRTHAREMAFRWHVGGDMINKSYFENVLDVARDNADYRQWTYSEVASTIINPVLDERECPDNLSIMLSRWEINVNGEWIWCEPENPHNLPTFTVVRKGQEPPEGVWQCPGKCKICLEKGRGCPYRESVWAWKH